MDMYSSYPLHEAILKSRESLKPGVIQIRTLLNLGEDVNKLDQTKSTPLSHCMKLNHHTVVCATEVILLLLEYKADPNIRDCKGRTLLHLAAWHGDLTFIQLCIKHGGGNINAVDKEGLKPVDLAAIMRHMEVMTYLETHSGDLRCLCRNAIREAAGKKYFSSMYIQHLPLPPRIKLFLNYRVPYPGFEAVLVPPAPWTEETWPLQESKSEDKFLTFIRENASDEFLEKHRSKLEMGAADDASCLADLIKEMYLWEAFKTVSFEEPLAREPRYSLTKIEKQGH